MKNDYGDFLSESLQGWKVAQLFKNFLNKKKYIISITARVLSTVLK